MKVIDLIDVKEKPKHIKLFGTDFYLNENSCEFRSLYLDKAGYVWHDAYIIALNENVEIVEDKPKKIELLNIECDSKTNNYYMKNEHGTKCFLTKHSKMIVEQQNEIAKALNYLLEKSDKE